jgi:exodeoxyribonuclease V alpha subunit
MPIELTGQVEHITYANLDNGYTIARVTISGRRDPVTVVGNLMSPAPGEVLSMEGEWTRHPKYGEQFKVSSYRVRVPATVQGIRKYLGSGMIKGLGPVMAGRIVDRFGASTLDVIENDADRLTEVAGVGATRVERIRAAWQAQKDIRDVMIFLQEHGVGTGHAAKIFKQYGHQSVRVVKDNPYRLATDIFGIGFLTADRIAAKLGFPKDSRLRAEAGVLFVLNQLADEGNVYYPRAALVERSREILEISPEPVAAAVARLAGDQKIVIENLNPAPDRSAPDDRGVYLKQFHICETGIADRLTRLRRAPRSVGPLDTEPVLDWAQQRLSIRLADNQVKALRCAVAEKVLVITGGPGTGKTTIINALIAVFARLPVKILLAAPTGRAAKRLGEASGREARTIHRLLEYSLTKGGFQRNDEHPLACHLLVVDEASMIDNVLMYHLLKAVPAGATLILVGDVNQLPSVGAGNVLKDIIDSGAVPVVTLTEIFRQARRSRIITNAHRINSGRMPEVTAPSASGAALSDFYFIHQEDPEKVVDTIVDLVRDRIPRRFGLDPLDDIQVLTPMHRGAAGAANLNQRLQDALNPGPDVLLRGDRRFRVLDKVMQIKNNYDKDVFNGDIGRIAAIDPVERVVRITVDDREVSYEFGELDEIVPAYAISVHKSQGSEYRAVILPVLTQHYILLQRNLIYTGVTRGRDLVILIGTPKALAIGIANDKTQQRYTHLRARLRDAP